MQSLPSGEVRIYSTQSLSENDVLAFSISGEPAEEITRVESPSAVTPQNDFDPVIIYGAGGIGLALLVTGIWMFLRNKREANENDDPDIEIPSETREEILDSIIALDDLFENGEITEKVYQQKRSQLKEKLKSVSGD